jgi:phosphotransferase system enzyme I (PtsP)
MRDRLHDLDDLSNRLLRILTGQGKETGADMPADPILIASNIGPAELLDYGRSLKGIVLEEGSVGSHATIVARALAIPLVIRAKNITTEALNGDRILVDGDQGICAPAPLMKWLPMPFVIKSRWRPKPKNATAQSVMMRQ